MKMKVQTWPGRGGGLLYVYLGASVSAAEHGDSTDVGSSIDGDGNPEGDQDADLAGSYGRGDIRAS